MTPDKFKETTYINSKGKLCIDDDKFRQAIIEDYLLAEGFDKTLKSVFENELLASFPISIKPSLEYLISFRRAVLSICPENVRKIDTYMLLK